MQYADWGERCPRWRGIRSETLDLDGRRVHLLRADPGPDALPDAPTRLLVHGVAGCGTAWLVEQRHHRTPAFRWARRLQGRIARLLRPTSATGAGLPGFGQRHH